MAKPKKGRFMELYNKKLAERGLSEDAPSSGSSLRNANNHHYDGEMISNYFIFLSKLTGGFTEIVDKMIEQIKKTNKERADLIENILKKYEEVGELDEELLNKMNLKKENIMEAMKNVAEGGEVNFRDLVDNAQKTLKLAQGLLSGQIDSVLDVKDVADTAVDGKKMIEHKKTDTQTKSVVMQEMKSLAEAVESEANDVFENKANDAMVSAAVIENQKSNAQKLSVSDTNAALGEIESVRKKAVTSNKAEIDNIHGGRVYPASSPKEKVQVYGGENTKPNSSLDSLKADVEKLKKEMSVLGYTFSMTEATSETILKQLRELEQKFDILKDTVVDLDNTPFDEEEDELNDFKLVDVDINEITRRVREQLKKETDEVVQNKPKSKKGVGLSKTAKRAIYGILAIGILGGGAYYATTNKIFDIASWMQKVEPMQTKLVKKTLQKGSQIRCSNTDIIIAQAAAVDVMVGKDGREFFKTPVNGKMSECEILKQ